MKKILSLIAVAAAFATVATSCQQHNTLTAAEEADGWLVQIPDEKESILKEGEWNTLRLRVEGNKVQTWLNGEPMIEIEDELIGNTPGRIMLQIHDGNNIKVLWKNFKLTTL